MRVQTLSVSGHECANGLESIKMERLGQLVALFGQNGSGKTRVLNVVARVFGDDSRRFERVEASLKQAESDDKQATQDCDKALAALVNARDRQEEVQVALRKAEARAEGCRQELAKWQAFHQAWDTRYAFRDEDAGIYRVDCTTLDLEGVESFQFKELKRGLSHYTAAAKPGDGNSRRDVMTLLWRLAQAAYHGEHTNAETETERFWASLYVLARQTILDMMSMEFGYGLDDGLPMPALNGRVIRVPELSRGQRVLLYYAYLLLDQVLCNARRSKKPHLRGAILLVDEPELHLHPGAVIELVRSLQRIVGETGQVWLATHCVALLAFVEPSELWLVEDGRVLAPGIDRTEKAMHALLGSREQIDRFKVHLEEPARWAAARFATECLLPPGQAGYRRDDPQLSQIASALRERVAPGKSLRVLDVGAGRGRVARMLSERLPNDASALVEYVAVEPNRELHDVIREAAGPVLFGDAVFTEVGALPTEFDESVDAAVLCNVIHEMRPTQWYDRLSSLLGYLKADGSLILCEDQEIGVGELPNELGYVVLGFDELQTLFGVSTPPQRFVCSEEQYRDRLLCMEVKRGDINLAPVTVEKAIENLRRRVKAEVRGLRGYTGSGSASAGRRYSRLTQMFVNCELALEELHTG